MNTSARLNPPARRQWPLVLLLPGACLLIGWLVFVSLFAAALEQERRQAAQRLDAFALSLDATLARHESLPGLVALDPALQAVLRAPDDPARQAAANAYLEAAQESAAVAVVFLMDARGRTVAASNWRLPRSFVGHNYAFRPYFRDALNKGLGRFYGVGVTTGEPGYFIAAPVRDGKRTLGVVALKVSLEGMEQALRGVGETLLLADADGVAFLASERGLRYRALAALSESAARRQAETQQYGMERIAPLADAPLPLDEQGTFSLALPGSRPREHWALARPVGAQGWRLVHIGDTREARRTALGGGVAAAFAAGFALAVAGLLRHRRRRREELRRIYDHLEERIALRTADLTEQIGALERTKAILRETRDAAVQAGKLATLGQMSAGISHELSQPLAAMQTFADNARALLARGRLEEASENLETISQLVERAGRIVRQLKSFARHEPAVSQPVSVAAAIEHALMIVEPRRREIGATIAVTGSEGWQVLAEAGRLEQILINLLRNGLDAMAGQPSPRLTLTVTAADGAVSLAVRDHGPGLSDDARGHLFEPFFTTKPAGEGLGLGLAISLTIAESYGGALSAHNADDGGAVFVLSLPAAGDPHATPDP